MLWITEICELNCDLRFLIEILDYKLIRFLLPFWNLLRTKPWKLLNTKVSLKFWWTLFDWEMLHTGSKIISPFLHNSINSYSLINYKNSRHKLLHLLHHKLYSNHSLIAANLTIIKINIHEINYILNINWKYHATNKSYH